MNESILLYYWRVSTQMELQQLVLLKMIYIKSHLNVKKTAFADSHVSLCVRWGVVVRRKAARVYQQSNGATERDPETH